MRTTSKQARGFANVSARCPNGKRLHLSIRIPQRFRNCCITCPSVRLALAEKFVDTWMELMPMFGTWDRWQINGKRITVPAE